MDKRIVLLVLLSCKGIGNKKALTIISECKYNIDYIKNYIIEKFGLNFYEEKYKELDNALSNEFKQNIKIITLFDINFPSKLLELSDPVLYLYYIGNIELINEKSIGIIGSRNISKEEENNALKAGKIFASNKIVVVSGLAIGVDRFAHEGCLGSFGKTIAVLPSNLVNIAPASNKELAKKIINNNGLLVSEYGTGSTINKFNYAKRDRIQSALSDVILVISANESSGTMIAVHTAYSLKKQVYQLSTNINSLIRKKVNIDDKNDIETILLDIDTRYNDSVSNNNEQMSLF